MRRPSAAPQRRIDRTDGRNRPRRRRDVTAKRHAPEKFGPHSAETDIGAHDQAALAEAVGALVTATGIRTPTTKLSSLPM